MIVLTIAIIIITIIIIIIITSFLFQVFVVGRGEEGDCTDSDHFPLSSWLEILVPNIFIILLLLLLIITTTTYYL